LSYQFAWGCPLATLPNVGLALQMKNSFMFLVVQNSFVLSTWILGASLTNVQKTYCHIKQLVEWPNLMLKGLEM
jgi:hypothetical protein